MTGESGVNLSESFKIALKCIRANWMRSLLTMLGIIIGISSVIMIIGAGTGAKDYIVSMIEDMGSNAIMISTDTTTAQESDYITLDDVDAIKSKVNNVDGCSPIMLGFGNATINDQKSATCMMVGVSADIRYAMTSDCAYGRYFNDEEYDASRPVAVIDSMSAQNAFGYEDVVGEYINVSSSGASMNVRIVGVASLESMMGNMGGDSNEMMANMSSMFGGADSDTVMISLFVPCTTLTEITGSGTNLSSIYVMASEGADYDAVGNATLNFLKARHGNADRNVYMVQNMATYIDLIDTIVSILTTFVACVAAISLVVGGIGVMNIMLVSVTERTREIGIRKSLGAKTSVITMQFLTESIILCLIGGALGVLIGVAGAYAVCSVINIQPTLTVGAVLLALLFSCGVGLFFGIYPARKAAQLSPIEALRRE